MKINKFILGECVEILDYKRIPLSSKERENLKKIYPYYGAQGIIDYVDDYIFDGEYILVAEDGNNLKTLQQNIATLVKGKFWVNNHAHILGEKKGVDLKYIYYLINILDLRGYITGSAQPKLNQENLKKIEINLPMYNIQKKIAKLLNLIDSKIELNNKINSELEAMAKTIYDYWFLQFEFPNEDGKPYKSSGGKMVWNDELKREIPEIFQKLLLKEIKNISVITGKTPSTKDETNFGNEVPFITIEDLRENVFVVNTKRKLSKKGANTQEKKYIPSGSICVSCIATIGEIAITTETSQTNQQINSVICGGEEIRNYLYFYLKNIFLNFKVKSGNIFSNMNKEEFESVKILLPTENILVKFSKIVSPILSKIEINTKENQELASLRDFLLPLLMNGQVGFEEE